MLLLIYIPDSRHLQPCTTMVFEMGDNTDNGDAQTEILMVNSDMLIFLTSIH